MINANSARLEKAFAAIGSIPGALAWRDLDLSSFAAWQIGGVVDLLVSVESTDALQRVIRQLNNGGIPWMTIGGTTNLLFSDGKISGALICLSQGFRTLHSLGDGRFIAGAGLWVPRFARAVAQSGWSGVEHAIGIPGTLGGLIAMNGGSQRKCIGDHIVEVAVVTREGEEVSFNAEECEFSRRHSAFQRGGDTIVSSVFGFTEVRSYAEARSEMRQIMTDRRTKFPMDRPNCGSVFVSDPATFDRYGPPGRLIEQCGLKGTSIGGAQISIQHANFIINNGGATARDVLSLIGLCIREVRSKFGVTMATEVKVVGRSCELHNAGAMALECSLER